MEARAFEMESHAFSIRFMSSRDSALGCMFSASSSSDLASKEAEAKPCSANSVEDISLEAASVQTHQPAQSQEQEIVMAQVCAEKCHGFCMQRMTSPEPSPRLTGCLFPALLWQRFVKASISAYDTPQVDYFNSYQQYVLFIGYS